jgi:protein O-GlcNAc transferase
MKDKGFVKEAIHCYVTAIRLMPNFAAAHSNLGSIFKEQGKTEQALAHYHEAIQIDPLFADAYSNLGNTYKEMGQLDEATKCYAAAIKIKPTFADAYANLAAAYKDSGQVMLAIQHYRQALQYKPDLPEAIANLVHTLVFVCDWTTRNDDFERLSQVLAQQIANPLTLPSAQPFHALIYPFSLTEQLQLSRRHAAKAKANVALVDARFIFRSKPKSIRLKIGYVSSDFGNHPLSHLMQSVFGMHDKTKFEVTCYALSPSDSSTWRHKIEGEAEHFKDVSKLHSGDAAQLIYNDGIHILVNLNGYTKGCRNEIFALHPAPLQVQYMGFCGTLGADYIDYIVGDKTVIPPELRLYYQEKVIEMPHSYFVNDHKQSSKSVAHQIDMPTREQYGIPHDKFVFCNFNQLFKIDPQIFDTWTNILKRVPNSVLWLLRFPPAGEENIRREAQRRGIRDEQIIFTDIAPRDEHLKRCYLADLFLDTPAYNAHTTACDVLWSGTPILTLRGEKMASRVAASLLGAAGLDELIKTSHNEYEELAVQLALDSERLYTMRRHLEENRDKCAVFDTTRWVRNLEKGLQQVWKRFEGGSAPGDVTVVDEE